MSTLTNKATIQTNDKRRIAQALCLAAMLVLSPIAVASDDSTKTTIAETDGDTRLIPDASIPPLSDGALGRAHAMGFCWEAPAVQIPAVIIWDEAGSVRRPRSGTDNLIQGTGSGNLIQVNVTTGSQR